MLASNKEWSSSYWIYPT